MFAHHLMTKSTAILSRIYNHPFNQQLCAGTLPNETFKFYLEQDALYLRDFSKALKLIADRCTDRRHARQFRQLSDDMISYELNIHFRYLKKAHPDTFFSTRQHPSLQKTPVITNYSEYLLNSASKAPIAEAVASCAPCFITYNELGRRMNNHYQQNNPYRDWIASYSRPQFTTSTQMIMQTMSELTSLISCPTLQDRVSDSFLQSTIFELMFFDAAYTAKAQPAAAHQPIELK
jgi:thiaminase/transcriptional activator TenA